MTGRKDDLLKVGGHRVDPQEIEDAMMATGLLLEAAVVGVDDELLGKKVVALAVPLSAGCSQSEILALCLAKLPRHKLPGEIRFVASLPKYANSKIDRPACLALFQDQTDKGVEQSGPRLLPAAGCPTAEPASAAGVRDGHGIGSLS